MLKACTAGGLTQVIIFSVTDELALADAATVKVPPVNVTAATPMVAAALSGDKRGLFVLDVAFFFDFDTYSPLVGLYVCSGRLRSKRVVYCVFGVLSLLFGGAAGAEDDRA